MKPILRFALRTTRFLGAAAVTVLIAAHAKAGDEDRRGNASALIPGYSQSARNQFQPVATETDARVEVRRATPVLDPRDATRISSGSLWKEGVANENGMFADRRARHRGDTLTIIVAENTVITNTIDQQSSKANSVSNGILDQYLLNLPKNLHIAKRATGTGTTGVTADNALGLTTSYKGDSQFNQQQSLNARAAVTVTDVLPNGNLVIEGTRIVSFSGETKYAELRGIVRHDDVAPDNTVLSTNVADAKVRYVEEGSLSDAQKKGWLSRGLDRFNPL